MALTVRASSTKKLSVIIAMGFWFGCRTTVHSPSEMQEPERRLIRVVFICQHGNVKSLMAAEYFNQLAKIKGLGYQAISRGIEPDSTSVPPMISKALGLEGFDVSKFRPTKMTQADMGPNAKVILLGVASESIGIAGPQVEIWDVPAASEQYAQASATLRQKVAELLEKIEKPKVKSAGTP
jgi:arsenate reductase (thioredoxin)